MLRSAILRYVCCIVLCYVVLCCVSCDVWSCVRLCYVVMLCYFMLNHIVYVVLFCVMLYYCQRAAEAKRPSSRGDSIIEPRVYLDVQFREKKSRVIQRKGKVR